MEIFENLSASSRLQQDELDAYSRAVVAVKLSGPRNLIARYTPRRAVAKR